MGEGINFAEYTVARKSEGKNKLARVALVLAYVLFALALIMLAYTLYKIVKSTPTEE